MKFARLYLKAFGPFRDRVLELPATGVGDLHLIHGPNEAGKSSTLRAVTSLLFGFDEHSPDAFMHKYSELRVGASLILADGKRLAAMRRKGRKNTLFPLDEASGVEITATPLPENTLDICMGGLDEALYQTLFGLDIEGLQDGSRELLKGEGEVGRSLFQAAAGLSSLRSLMAGLDDNAAATFKARGSTTPLNRSLQEFEDQRRVLRECTVKSSAWENAEKDLRRAEHTLAERRAMLNATRSDQQRLERLRINLPLLAERELNRVELTALADVVALPSDFRERRVAAEVELRGAAQTQAGATARLTALQAETAVLVVRDAVLAQAAAIERAYHRIPSFRAAREGLPLGEQRRDELAARLQRLLTDMELPCALAALLPSETLRARALSLIDEDARLAEREQHFDRELPLREVALERLTTRLAALPEGAPVDALELSLKRIANLADLEDRRRAGAREVREQDNRLRDELSMLWPGSLADLLATRVPLPATATGYEAEFGALAQDERLLAEQAQMLARDVAERQHELRGLAASGEVVTQAEVAAARAARDAQWHQLRGSWLEARAADAPDAAAAARAGLFEVALREADRLADLLHADVERATKAAEIRLRIHAMQDEATRQGEHRAQLAERRAALEARWQALLAPLQRRDLSPAALREWLARHARLIERHGELVKLHLAGEELDAELERGHEVLQRALADCGLAALGADERVAEALERAQRALVAARSASSERAALFEQVETRRCEMLELQAQHARLLERRAAWQSQWLDVVTRLQLSDKALAAEVRTRLEQFARVAAGLEELRQLEASASAQRAVLASFETSLAVLVQQVEEAAPQRAADVIAERLYAALGTAREAQARAQRLASDIERERQAVAEAERSAQQAAALLDELRRQADGASIEQLPQLEDRAARRRELEARLADIDTQLVRHNARAVEAVLTDAEGQTLDGVEGGLDTIAAALEVVERDVDAAQETVFATRRVFEAIDGGPAAAEAQQALGALATRIAGEARAYARLRLAHAVLGRVVQRYRERHQGPLLARAAAIFRRITLASFESLTVDYEGERQVLLGVRPDEQRVPIAGMSQGTRDQLFLALRLAAIEQHIASRGPFPVIVDDLLVQFDDARALATLEVLAELATRTQVLFFTHHQHLVTLAQGAAVGRAISVQRL